MKTSAKTVLTQDPFRLSTWEWRVANTGNEYARIPLYGEIIVVTIFYKWEKWRFCMSWDGRSLPPIYPPRGFISVENAKKGAAKEMKFIAHDGGWPIPVPWCRPSERPISYFRDYPWHK